MSCSRYVYIIKLSEGTKLIRLRDMLLAYIHKYKHKRLELTSIVTHSGHFQQPGLGHQIFLSLNKSRQLGHTRTTEVRFGGEKNINKPCTLASNSNSSSCSWSSFTGKSL